MNDLVKPQLFSYFLTHFIHYTHILTVLIELFKIKIGQILLYIKRKELQERKMNGEMKNVNLLCINSFGSGNYLSVTKSHHLAHVPGRRLNHVNFKSCNVNLLT
jgi:hypothetical protein